MLFPEDVARRLRRSWPERRRRELLGHAEWPLRIALGPPTETEAATAMPAFRSWVAAWDRWAQSAEVEWEEREWSRIGRQRVPRRLLVGSPGRLAEIVGAAAEWQSIVARSERLRCELRSEAVRSGIAASPERIIELSDVDFSRLITVARWLVEPRPRAVYLRELPIPGVHTKWIEAHEPLVRHIVAAAKGIDPALGTAAVCGLREAPPTLRVRFACPQLRSAVGGLRDVEAPVTQLADLGVRPIGALVVENLVSARALEDIPGVVVFAALGAGVSLLTQLPWAREIPWGYWGDLDTHGYSILDRARALHQTTDSLLMDAETLLDHQELWGKEPIQHMGDLEHLTPAEREVCTGLREHRWGDRVRLEQERVRWDRVMSSVERWRRCL